MLQESLLGVGLEVFHLPQLQPGCPNNLKPSNFTFEPPTANPGAVRLQISHTEVHETDGVVLADLMFAKMAACEDNFLVEPYEAL